MDRSFRDLRFFLLDSKYSVATAIQATQTEPATPAAMYKMVGEIAAGSKADCDDADDWVLDEKVAVARVDCETGRMGSASLSVAFWDCEWRPSLPIAIMEYVRTGHSWPAISRFPSR